MLLHVSLDTVKILEESYTDEELDQMIANGEFTSEQVAELKAAQEKLTNSAQKVFAKMYDNAQAAQGAAGAGPDMSNMGGFGGNAGGASSADDDVIDADFKEV